MNIINSDDTMFTSLSNSNKSVEWMPEINQKIDENFKEMPNTAEINSFESNTFDLVKESLL